jgi:peptidyl-tRNA hydrolase, PTH1 family
MLVEGVASKWGARWKLEKKFQAKVAVESQLGAEAIFCLPQTFMNSSGESVGAIQRFYKLPLERILIVVDDADLPLGQLRMRAEGSSGGHHGLESVEQQLGTRAYPRLRLGIGRRAEDGRQISGYVLGRFAAGERGTLKQVLDRGVKQVECWLSAGIQEAMNAFNGAVTAPPEKGK